MLVIPCAARSASAAFAAAIAPALVVTIELSGRPPAPVSVVVRS